MGNPDGKGKKFFLLGLLILALVTLSAVCFHSIEEIHYLKSFFPQSFTVQDAFYASAIELIKVTILILPLVLIIVVCLVYLKQDRQ